MPLVLLILQEQLGIESSGTYVLDRAVFADTELSVVVLGGVVSQAQCSELKAARQENKQEQIQ